VKKIIYATFVSLIALACWPGSQALAGQGRPMSDEDRQAILAYQLSLSRANAILDAMGEMTRYIISRPDARELMQRSMKMTHAEQAAQMEHDPQAMAIAAKHGLTARDYTYGGPALRMALMAAQGVGGADLPVSPANLAFAKANLATLKPKMDAVDGAGMRGRGEAAMRLARCRASLALISGWPLIAAPIDDAAPLPASVGARESAVLEDFHLDRRTNR